MDLVDICPCWAFRLFVSCVSLSLSVILFMCSPVWYTNCLVSLIFLKKISKLPFFSPYTLQIGNKTPSKPYSNSETNRTIGILQFLTPLNLKNAPFCTSYVNILPLCSYNRIYSVLKIRSNTFRLNIMWHTHTHILHTFAHTSTQKCHHLDAIPISCATLNAEQMTKMQSHQRDRCSRNGHTMCIHNSCPAHIQTIKTQRQTHTTITTITVIISI